MDRLFSRRVNIQKRADCTVVESCHRAYADVERPSRQEDVLGHMTRFKTGEQVTEITVFHIRTFPQCRENGNDRRMFSPPVFCRAAEDARLGGNIPQVLQRMFFRRVVKDTSWQ